MTMTSRPLVVLETMDDCKVVSLTTRLASTAQVRKEIRWLDTKAMHEKVCGILATIIDSNENFAKKHGANFYYDVVLLRSSLGLGF